MRRFMSTCERRCLFLWACHSPHTLSMTRTRPTSPPSTTLTAHQRPTSGLPRWVRRRCTRQRETSSGLSQRICPARMGTCLTRVLTAETVRLMRKPHASTMGIDVWGLGTILYSSNNEGDVIFGHDGQGGLQSTRQPDSTLGLATASSFWRLGIGFSLQGSRANGASGKQEESISRSFLSRS